MWAPDQYTRFRTERKQPFTDLVSLIEKRPRMRVADLGCGTGDLTRELHETLGATETIGIDNSETMLLKSGHFEGEMLRFEKGDVEAFVSDRPFDLMFSNAAFHWVSDHEQLFPRLTNLLSATGQIAIQFPANDDHASHRIAAEVGREFGVAERPDYVLPLERYAELLHRLGYARQHVRMQVYGHVLPSSNDVIEWVRGALLTHYESLLGNRFTEYLDVYRERLLAAIGDEQPFFYTYKRILMWASF
jgi:trans-aconitate 2-methyltransferase